MPWLSKRPAARLMLARWRFQGACLGEVTLTDPSADTSGSTDRNDFCYITLTIEVASIRGVDSSWNRDFGVKTDDCTKETSHACALPAS